MDRETKNKAEKKDQFAREAMAHLDHLYRVAFHLAKESDEAQDLVQEAYARALGSYEQFAPGSNMKAWVTRILYNLFSDRYRQRKKMVLVEDSFTEREETSDYWETVPAQNPGPENQILQKELNTKITDALKKIPQEFRLPIVLVDMGDFSYEEAAEILSCPLGTIRSRLSRGRRLVHKHLQDYVGIQERKRENK